MYVFSENNSKANINFGGTKVCKDEEVRKYFLNPKIEKVFGLCVNCIISSLDFTYTEAVARRCSSEEALLEISQCWSFLLIKLHAFRHSEICKIFNSIFFIEYLRWLSLFGTYWLSSAYFILLCVFRFFQFLSLFLFFCGFYYLGMEVSLSILQIKHWNFS